MNLRAGSLDNQFCRSENGIDTRFSLGTNGKELVKEDVLLIIVVN